MSILRECIGSVYADLIYLLIETLDEWVLAGFSHPISLAEIGATGQSQLYAIFSLDLVMKDAFRNGRRFLTTTQGFSQEGAIVDMSAAVDSGVNQVVDSNRGVCAIIKKSLFRERNPNI